MASRSNGPVQRTTRTRKTRRALTKEAVGRRCSEQLVVVTPPLNVAVVVVVEAVGDGDGDGVAVAVAVAEAVAEAVVTVGDGVAAVVVAVAVAVAVAASSRPLAGSTRATNPSA